MPLTSIPLLAAAATLLAAVLWGLVVRIRRRAGLVPAARDRVLEDMADGVLILDHRDVVLDANAAAGRILGRTPQRLLGLHRFEALRGLAPHGDPRDGLCHPAPNTGDRVYQRFESEMRGRNGRVRGGTLVLRDVTEQVRAEQDRRCAREDLERRVEQRTRELLDANARLVQEIADRRQSEERRVQPAAQNQRLQAQVLHSHRLETLGTLAGGIAHDFNNVLAAILGYADMARAELDPDMPASGDLKEVVRAANRARELVRQILSFGRRADPERSSVRLDRVVREAAALLRASIPTTVELEVDVDESCPEVLADSTQIHQVLMNLGTNAAHALEGRGGTIAVRLEPDGDPSANGGVRLVVTDDGEGIAPDLLPHVFDPFFTTREPGRGTGLGLSVVKNAVEGHHGTIHVDSEPGRGTTFTVRLPAARPADVPAEAGPPSRPNGSEVVLFVDDEPQIADLGSRMLTRLGFTVVSTTSPTEALELFAREPERFDVVVSDQTMPDLTGDALASRILEIRPEARVVLTTGFSDSLTLERCRELGVKALIMKPVTGPDLGSAIRDVLDGVEPSEAVVQV